MRAQALVMTAIVIACALTGCSPISEACADFPDYESPEDMGRDASLVIVGTSAPSHATATVLGVPAAVHRIDISLVVKSESDAYDLDSIVVASTPATCQDGGYYPDGDPLDTDETVEVFLYQQDDGTWVTLTPFDGVLPVAQGEPIPWTPAASTTS
jgi:hypothetical protein